MSSKTSLPPRCPRRGSTVTRPVHGPLSRSFSEDAALYNQHQKRDQGSSTLKQKLEKLNCLVTDSDPSQSQSDTISQKSVIDSVAVSDGVSSQTPSSDNDHESVSSIGTVAGLESTGTYGPNSPKSKDGLSSTETDVSASDGVVSSQALSSVNNDHESVSSIGTVAGLESTCTYGPNSPKSKDGLRSPETALSEISKYFSQNPFRNSDDGFLITEMLQCDLVQDASNYSVGETSSETARRRHNRERARSHKHHYVTALERSVDGLQSLGADLALRVSSSLQQRAVLSFENNNLKQQISLVEQAKLIAEGEYRSLKREEAWLKSMLDFSYDGRCNPGDVWSSSGDAGISVQEASWPDMRKLDLR